MDEKLRDKTGAHDAYAKYLEVASDAKNAAEIKKRMEKLKQSANHAHKPVARHRSSAS